MHAHVNMEFTVTQSGGICQSVSMEPMETLSAEVNSGLAAVPLTCVTLSLRVSFIGLSEKQSIMFP